MEHKIFIQEDLIRKVLYWKFKEDKIIFTNGCFDLLHPGHLEILSKAAEFGDRLVVGLNSDNSVEKLKGKNRPLLNEEHRCEMLAALSFVDAIVVFDDPTPIELIKACNPDFLVKGADYTIDTVVGADWVMKNGGRVELIPLLNGFSSTQLIEKIQQVDN